MLRRIDKYIPASVDVTSLRKVRTSTPLTDRLGETIAHQVSAMLDHDGTRWTAHDGRHICDISADADVVYDVDRDLARYEYEDGSAIVVGASGWDIEGATPWSWAGA